jgi:hypothetical protein
VRAYGAQLSLHNLEPLLVSSAKQQMEAAELNQPAAKLPGQAVCLRQPD